MATIRYKWFGIPVTPKEHAHKIYDDMIERDIDDGMINIEIIQTDGSEIDIQARNADALGYKAVAGWKYVHGTTIPNTRQSELTSRKGLRSLGDGSFKDAYGDVVDFTVEVARELEKRTITTTINGIPVTDFERQEYGSACCST